MKLRSKLCLSYLAVGLIPLLVIGLYVQIYLREEKFQSISEFFIAQLAQIDLTLSGFLQEVEYDVASLANSKLVRTRADAEFTNFLQANEQTFTYQIGDVEQQIVDILVNYQDQHAYVNSVYMGRANGAFVRSHPRASPTQYDPRERPWYQLAVSQPDRVMRTAPYKSVTTDDINIGIVKALVDERNAVFGVVGADITLGELTTVVSHWQTGREGYIMLIDEQGVILSNPVQERRFQHYDKVGLAGFQTVMTNDRGQITFQDAGRPSYAFFYTSPRLHWKICAIVPVTEIEREIVQFSNTLIWVVMATLLVGGIQSYYLARRITIPINALIQGIRRLAALLKAQQAFEKIQTATKGEIATLAEAFNAMGAELFTAHRELHDYNKNLETIVARRTQELSGSNAQLVAEIAERRRAQAAADAANRAKSDFLANMSHELRTPLNGILGYTQILARDLALTPKQQEAIAVIHRSGEHLLRLINEILDLAKIEARKMTLEPDDFHLPECLQSVAAMAAVRAEQKGLTFVYHAPAALPVIVSGDEKRLSQVLLNLLGNAIKFTEKGTVSLRVDALPELNTFPTPQLSNSAMLRFEVTDTGSGIPSDQLAQVFEVFYRVGAQQVEGTGLGLAISQRIVQLMGSELHVESPPSIPTASGEKPSLIPPHEWGGRKGGPGSRFWFDLLLPISTEPPAERRALGEHRRIIGFTRAPGECAGCTVIVADDRADNRAVLKEMLQPLGFEILEAVNGRETLEKVRASQPDIVLLDLVMPELDGLTVARHLRQDPDARDLIIIAVSASAFEQNRQDCLAAGCNEYLPKPFQLEVLLEALRVHLRLEWVYAAESSPPPTSLPDQPLRRPPPDVLAELYDILMSGDLDRLQAQATQLAQADAVWQPFTTKLCRLANEFRLEELRLFLQMSLTAAA